MRTRSFAFALIAAAALVAGCAGPNESGSSTTSPSPATAVPASLSEAGTARPRHAVCLVCEKNADLACVDVAVDATTPTYNYGGQTYYFCSDECRDKFAKDPGKYLVK